MTEMGRNLRISWRFGGSAPALLNDPPMMRRGFFRREVEVLLQLMGGALVLGAFVLTLAWGYAQRQEAEAWRAQACTYRFADLARRATFLGDDSRDACTRLQSLGLGLRT
jgi:hypothetical protein